MSAVDVAAKVVENGSLGAGCWSLVVVAPEIAATSRPGQFVMAGVDAGLRPFLRRAFSVADVDGDRIEIIGKTIGVGTAAIEAAAVGSTVHVLGPLGEGYDLEAGSGAVGMVAGGIGIAPFPLVARELAKRGREARLYFGGRGEADLILRDRLSSLLGDDALRLATDDGSMGRHGRVTELLDDDLERGDDVGLVLACGPMPMFRALAEVVGRRGVASEFAMEREMACGFGVCLACVVPAREGGWLTVCGDGPCLPPDRIDWERA